MVIFRNFKETDIDDLISLMEEIKPSVAGMKDVEVYRALCNDALHNDKVTIALADDDGVISGFVIAISDWKRFWLIFFLRHPLLAVRIIFYRLPQLFISPRETEKKLERKKSDIEHYLSETTADRSWNDNSRKIAKTVFIGIRTSSRGKKLGRNLFLHLFFILALRGIERLDGHINPNNSSAIKMHHSVGFRIERSGSDLFATKNLSS